MPKSKHVDLILGSEFKIENLFDFNRVTLAMGRVRPFIAGSRPVLGVSSAKPSGWSSFRGIHLYELEDLLGGSLWKTDRDNERAGGQRSRSRFANEEQLAALGRPQGPFKAVSILDL